MLRYYFPKKCVSKIPHAPSNSSKFIYSEKATKFCELFLLLLTVCTVVKSKGKILQNFVAFSKYMNFIKEVNEMKKYCKVYMVSCNASMVSYRLRKKMYFDNKNKNSCLIMGQL